MRKATRTVATCLGLLAGFAGLEHGWFEVLQGNTRPQGLMILSMGPPCDPLVAWSGCEPAMTILPSFLVSGILSMILGLAVMIWSAVFIQRKAGGLVLIGLSVLLLLFGGGIFPPVIGMVGGAAGTQINKPIPPKAAGGLLRFAAKLWPWPLVIFMVWTLGQFPMGTFFNDFLKSIMYYGILLILTMMPLSVYVGYARDVQAASGRK